MFELNRKKRRSCVFVLSLFALGGILLPELSEGQLPKSQNTTFRSPATTGVVALSEDVVINQLNDSSPGVQQARANKSGIRFQRYAIEQKYQWQWVSAYEQTDSDEKPISSFAPTYGPTYSYSTGLKKKIAGGAAVTATAFSNQTSTVDGLIDEATRSGVRFGFSIDLWKNLLGRVDRAELAEQKFQEEKAKIETDLNIHGLNIDVRKLYWSMVANNEQIKIAEELQKTSAGQLRDARKRGKQYIADKAEIARYKAQLSSREATLKGLKYQRDALIRDLKRVLPSLSDKQVVLAPVDIDKIYSSVYQCAVRIGSYTGTPWSNTKIDELVHLVEKSFQERKTQTSRYSDIDLTLDSELQYSGVDQGYQESIDDFNDDRGEGYSVGLNLTIPLGSSDKKARVAQETRDRLLFQAEKSRLLSDVKAQHTQIVPMVQLLRESIANLKDNSDNLAISIRSSRRKYKQARISINDLLTEQDALLNTKLNEVDSKLLVIHTLLDYFKTFSEDPCEVNRKLKKRKVAQNG